jgi:hypothetical protein
MELSIKDVQVFSPMKRRKKLFIGQILESHHHCYRYYAEPRNRNH